MPSEPIESAEKIAYSASPLLIRVGFWYQLRNGEQTCIKRVDPVANRATGYELREWNLDGSVVTGQQHPCDIIGEVSGRPVESPPQATCETCRFWEPPPQLLQEKHAGHADGLHGHCRRHAPAVGSRDVAVFPSLSRVNWCGEHEPIVPQFYSIKQGAFASDPICLSCGKPAKPGSVGDQLCPHCNERLDGQGSFRETGQGVAVAQEHEPAVSEGEKCPNCESKLIPQWVSGYLICPKCSAQLA